MIVAVAGGKGGVGRSTVAHNLGYELDAVVVDGDLATPDLPSDHGPGIEDVLAGRIDPTDAVRRLGSVRLLPCSGTLAGAFAADTSRFPAAIERVEHEFGDVVIDCPADLSRYVGVQFGCADCSILVTTPDRVALLDTLRTKRFAVDLDAPIARVALNRVDPSSSMAVERDSDAGSRNLRGAIEGLRRMAGGRDGDTESSPPDPVRDIEAGLRAPTTVLAERPAIARSRRRGEPLREVEPTSPAVERFAALARTLDRWSPPRSTE